MSDESTPTSAHAVAVEVRRRLGEVGESKLHKLLYYAAGWHITWTDEELFAERVEAWTNGPVVAGLWRDEHHGRSRPTPEDLTDSQLATLDYVLQRYGHLSGRDLIRMTHAEDPWRSISESDSFDTGSVEITTASMKAWFAGDDQFVHREAEVARLRRARPGDSFGLPERSVDLMDAVARTLEAPSASGQRTA